MPRHHAILVHNQLSSYLKSGLLKSPPPAYSALLNYPPAPTPPRQRLPRPRFDLPTCLRSGKPSSSQYKELVKSQHPLPITYPEHDELRKAFYRDHPFEAYRPKSLVEVPDDLVARTMVESVRRILDDGTLAGPSDLVGVHNWTELRQKTLVPAAEDCINFAYALYRHHPAGYNLNSAYQISVSQFRTLRFEQQISTSFARQEAEFFGAKWGRDLLKRQLQNQDVWIKDQEGMDKIKSPSDNGPRSAPSIAASRSTSLGNGLDTKSGDRMLYPFKRQDGEFTGGKSYLKEISRKSKRLQTAQVQL